MDKFQYLPKERVFQIDFRKDTDSNWLPDFDVLASNIAELREILPFKVQISVNPRSPNPMELQVFCTARNVTPEEAEVAKKALLKRQYYEVP